MTNIR